MGYDFATQGTQALNTGKMSSGNYILAERTIAEFWTPSYKLPQTIIRIFPNPDPSTATGFGVMRLSARPFNFGGWIRAYPCAKLGSTDSGGSFVQFLIDDGTHSKEELRASNPVWLLYNNINDAVRKKIHYPGCHEWGQLVIRGSKGFPLAKPSSVTLVQGAVFLGGDGPYDMDMKAKRTVSPSGPIFARGADPEDPPVVIGLFNTAADALIDTLEARDPNWSGDTDDLRQFLAPDITDIHAGAFVHIYKQGEDPRTQAVATQQPQVGFGAQFGSRNTQTNATRGLAGKPYMVFLTPTHDGTDNGLPASMKGHEGLVRAKWQSWENIINFPTPVRQAEIIATRCNFPASAMEYAWRDFPEWIPASVRSAAANAVSAQVPAGVPDKTNTGDTPVGGLTPARPSGGGWGRTVPPMKVDPVTKVHVQDCQAPVTHQTVHVPAMDNIVPRTDMPTDPSPLQNADLPSVEASRMARQQAVERQAAREQLAR